MPFDRQKTIICPQSKIRILYPTRPSVWSGQYIRRLGSSVGSEPMLITLCTAGRLPAVIKHTLIYLLNIFCINNLQSN